MGRRDAKSFGRKLPVSRRSTINFGVHVFQFIFVCLIPFLKLLSFFHHKLTLLDGGMKLYRFISGFVSVPHLLTMFRSVFLNGVT